MRNVEVLQYYSAELQKAAENTQVQHDIMWPQLMEYRIYTFPIEFHVSNKFGWLS